MRTETETYESGSKTVEIYDEQDRKLRSTDYNPDGSIDWDTRYWYAEDGYSDGYEAFNSEGILVTRFVRRYGSPYPTVLETHHYNNAGQLEDVKVETYDENGRLTVKYDADGRETERTQGSPPNKRFYLMRNAAFFDLEDAERLVQEDPSLIHERNSIGETPFHFLVVENAHEAVRWLFAHGSDINTRNDMGNTPLLEAAGLGYVEMCEWLLANGADLRIQNKSGETAVSTAATSEQLETLELFLARIPPDEDINSYFNNLTANVLLDKQGRAAERLQQRGLSTQK